MRYSSGILMVLAIVCILVLLCIVAGCAGAGGSKGGNGGNGGGNGGSGAGTPQDSGSDEDYQEVNSYISPDCTVVYHYYDGLSGNSEDGSIHFQGDIKNQPINGYQYYHGEMWSTSSAFVNHADPTVPMTGEHTCTINGVTTKSRYNGPTWVEGHITHGLLGNEKDPTKLTFYAVIQGNTLSHVQNGESDKYVTGEKCPYKNDPHSEAGFYEDLVSECYLTDASDPGSHIIPIAFEDGYKITYSFIFDKPNVIKKDSTVTLHVIHAGETPVSLAPLVTDTP
jgi:hypothetical protein